jgi:hypothetical protein
VARGGLAALALVAVILAGCGDDGDPAEALPTPSVGRATVVRGQPPVVWLSAQTEEVAGDHLVVVEPSGSRIRLERLSGDATTFLSVRDGEWHGMADPDVELIEVGTPLCIESLLDATTYLALRVFVGAVCGPNA